MGNEPLVLTLNDWDLEITISDHWCAVMMHDRSKQIPHTHYMRLSHMQARQLREYLRTSLPLSDEELPSETESMDCAMRVLWALVERAGGTITVSDQEAGPVTGAAKVSWENGSITVSIGRGASSVQQ